MEKEMLAIAKFKSGEENFEKFNEVSMKSENNIKTLESRV